MAEIDKKVNRQEFVKNFEATMKGKMDDDKIKLAVEKINNENTPKYYTTGDVTSYLFYLRLDLGIKGGKLFRGDSGGISLPGGGVLVGYVFTDDIDKLYSDTISFSYESAALYFNTLFFDGHSNLLGHFEGGVVGMVAGIGGGKGSWKK